MGAEGCSNSNQIDSLFSTSQLPGLNLRIGSVKVRHSRVQLAEHPGEGDDGEGDLTFAKGDNGWIPFRQETPRDFKLEEDENWSLVDLLSCSASAKTERRSRSSKSVLLVSHKIQRIPETEVVNRNVPRFLQSQSGVNRGGARLWRASQQHPLAESHEDNDADTEDNCDESEFNCRMSSGSSISWAEDAVETEQSELLAKLWNDVEVVCAGGPRPQKMTDAVYEECLLWRRAFPVESSIRPVRFEFMQDHFLTANEVEDEDSTPTNDISTFTEKPDSSPQLAMNLRSRVLDEHDSLMPNKGTTTEFVTSWLSDCHLLGAGTDGKYLANDVPNNVLLSECEDPRKCFGVSEIPKGSARTRNNNHLLPESPGLFGFATEQVGANAAGSKREGERNDCAKNEAVRQLDQWIPGEEKDKEIQGKILEVAGGGDAFDCKSPDSERPSRLPIPIAKEDKFRVRRNSAKPFLLWVFDRVSPS